MQITTSPTTVAAAAASTVSAAADAPKQMVARFTFPIEAGFLSRGAIKDVENGVRQIGHMAGVETELAVDAGSGWLSKVYTFRGTYTGAEDAVRAAAASLEAFIRSI